ncbi:MULTISPECIES: universal stress protein [Gracilibacillus]|uniref:universal stress protein n=1 Tax=Gracilibacillus TaxID=74385 RepID=UPI0008247201|nr:MULTISPECIES: universal stress protein [Gracilibacillus]
MYKQIILAVDGSDHSIRATEETVKIASLVKDSHIEVVSVAEFSKAKNEVLHSGGKEELEISRRKALLPATELLDAHHLSYEIKILHGEPGPTIVEYTNKGDYELLVIGSRGLNAFQEMVLGSVSHKVVKRVDCPVLIVK